MPEKFHKDTLGVEIERVEDYRQSDDLPGATVLPTVIGKEGRRAGRNKKDMLRSNQIPLPISVEKPATDPVSPTPVPNQPSCESSDLYRDRAQAGSFESAFGPMPDIAVAFKLSDGTEICCQVHTAVVTDKIIVIGYDTRFKLGTHVTPPESSAERPVTFTISVKGSKPVTAENFGFKFHLDNLDMSVYIITEDTDANEEDI